MSRVSQALHLAVVEGIYGSLANALCSSVCVSCFLLCIKTDAQFMNHFPSRGGRLQYKYGKTLSTVVIGCYFRTSK